MRGSLETEITVGWVTVGMIRGGRAEERMGRFSIWAVEETFRKEIA